MIMMWDVESWQDSRLRLMSQPTFGTVSQVINCLDDSEILRYYTEKCDNVVIQIINNLIEVW